MKPPRPRSFSLFHLLSSSTFLFLSLTACGAIAPALPTPTFTPPPTPPIIASPIPITNAEGTPIAEQPGFVEWVLLSGVDEHGLLVEHMLTLFAEPDPNATLLTQIHTGHPVMVLEIRHVGPQNLQRFYYVETLDHITGWISDYYVRRKAYVFNKDAEQVTLFDAPEGAEIGQLPNVAPVTLLQPQDFDWWQVSSLDGSVVGWVPSTLVKESPERDFLLGTDHAHPCENCPYFLP